MQRSKRARATDAPRALPPPLEEDIVGALRRLEEKRSSRPPPLEARAARAIPFESMLGDFVSDVSRKRGTAPP